MARVPGPLGDALLGVLRDAGLDALLGGALYPPRNWHQTLSDLQPPDARAALRRACAELVAEGAELRLGLLESAGPEPGRIHWRFVPADGKSDGLSRLLAALRARLRAEGLAAQNGHRPHVTISYGARQGIAPLNFPPQPWQIDTIELVEAAGRGKDYRYDTVDAWPLRPPATPPPTQLSLLS
jgi:2'-5' RNA ligase